MTPNPSNKHHYIPEFYTKRWAIDNGKMVRFKRTPNGKIHHKKVTPGAIGYEYNLYTDPKLSGHDAQVIEDKLFRSVDQCGSNIIIDLIKGRMPLTSKSRSKWVAFMLSLACRTPKDLSACKKAFALLVEELSPNESIDPMVPDQLAKNYLWTFMRNKFLGDLLANMTWDIIDFTGSGYSLLTSDNPIIMSNGLQPLAGHCAIALSPAHLFCCSWIGPYRSNIISLTKEELANRFNTYIVQRAREFVISVDETPLGFVEKNFGVHPMPSPLESLLEMYRSKKIQS